MAEIDNQKIKQLQKYGRKYKLLYIEDNDLLRSKALVFFKKFFQIVASAEDGKTGLEEYKTVKPDIIVTDIEMPNINGIDMVKKIRENNKDVIIIFTTAYDTVEYLHDAIDLNIFKYLVKPLDIHLLVNNLLEAIMIIENKKDEEYFNNLMKTIFHEQTSLVFLLNNQEITIANKQFYKFFNIEEIQQFKYKNDIGELFLEQIGFLYNTPEKNWYQNIKENLNKLYNVKMFNSKKEMQHFILSAKIAEDDKDNIIIVLNNVTDLGLLPLFDDNISYDELDIKMLYKATMQMLEVVYNNGGTLKIYNYYKGLIVTQETNIIDVGFNTVTLRVNKQQLKAVLYEKEAYITTDLLPYSIRCDELINYNKEHLTVTFEDIHFVNNSPIYKEYAILRPSKDYKVTLFYEDSKLNFNASVYAISIQEFTLKVPFISYAIQKTNQIKVDIVLSFNLRHHAINTRTTITDIIETKSGSFLIVCKIDNIANDEKKILAEYVQYRQKELVAEFKKLVI